jgi:N,N'-diacetyllegionaminate synthase
MAVEAGADAIKFQIFRPDEVLARDDLEFAFDVLVDRQTGETRRHSARLYDLLEERALSEAEWREVARLARERDLQIFFTVGTEADVGQVVSLGATSIKIASGDVTYRQLIQTAAETGLPLQLDSGAGTADEVQRAVSWVLEVPGNGGVIAHHCPSGYPAAPRDVRLRQITALKSQLGVPVAFSDHSPGWDMDVAAVTLGASMVEKTVTFDRMTCSIEHVQSIEWPEVLEFVTAIRRLDQALLPLAATRVAEPNVVARRSPYLVSAARAGTKLADVELRYLRPYSGLAPYEVVDLGQRELARDLPAGHCLESEDVVG